MVFETIAMEIDDAGQNHKPRKVYLCAAIHDDPALCDGQGSVFDHAPDDGLPADKAQMRQEMRHGAIRL
jgi:hypothetical protein